MLTANDLVAFFIGLSGSVHCVGMCGPLAFAMPAGFANKWQLVGDKLLYNFGRIISYSALGLLLGFIGKAAWLAGMQRSVSIISGIVILLAGFIRLFKFHKSGNLLSNSSFISKLIVTALKKGWGNLVVGVLNGLLPCGFVYIALFGALTTSSPAHAALFMFWFGVGTTPLMLALAIGSTAIKPAIRVHINKMMPYLTVILGLWFILRGSNLNIPYLSPLVRFSGVSICHP